MGASTGHIHQSLLRINNSLGFLLFNLQVEAHGLQLLRELSFVIFEILYELLEPFVLRFKAIELLHQLLPVLIYLVRLLNLLNFLLHKEVILREILSLFVLHGIEFVSLLHLALLDEFEKFLV